VDGHDLFGQDNNSGSLRRQWRYLLCIGVQQVFRVSPCVGCIVILRRIRCDQPHLHKGLLAMEIDAHRSEYERCSKNPSDRGEGEDENDSYQRDPIEPLGEIPLVNFDKFSLQLHLNKLATTGSKDHALQMRAYLRDIFAEAVDQDFFVKDPARKVKVPTRLRPTYTTTLT
jgi:hypothetical protein